MIFLFPFTLIVVLEPVLVTSQMFSPWILSQIWIQRIHLIHLRESRMSGNVLSQGVSSKRSLNGRSIRFRSFCNLLKCTVPASDTGCTFAVMLGKDKLYSLSSCNAYLRAVRVDHHAFGYNVITGCDQTIFPSISTTQTRQAAISFISFK